MQSEIDTLQIYVKILNARFEDEQPVDVCKNTIVIEGLPFEEEENVDEKVYALLGEMYGSREVPPDIVQTQRYKTYYLGPCSWRKPRPAIEIERNVA